MSRFAVRSTTLTQTLRHYRSWLLLVCCLLLGLAWQLSRTTISPVLAAEPLPAPKSAQLPAVAQQLAAQYSQQLVPFLKKYCVDCHSGAEAESMLDVTKYKSGNDVLADRRTWRNISQKIRNHEMPPSDHDAKPSANEIEQASNWIDQTLKAAVCGGPVDPGRVTIRRLNRAEYNNTIRDLCGVDFKPADDFPSDDVGYGFDNIGDVLALPPILLEKYLAAAEKVLDKAIVIDDPSKAPVTRMTGKQLAGENGDVLQGTEHRMLYSDGDVWGEFNFPGEGMYQIRVQAFGEQAGPDPCAMSVKVDKDELKSFEVPNDRFNLRTYTVTQKFTAGKRRVTARYTNDFYEPKQSDAKKGGDRNLGVGYIEVRGPLGLNPDKLPESHKRIMVVTPPPAWLDEQLVKKNSSPLNLLKKNDDRKKAEQAAAQRREQRISAAKRILATFATRAFRRPATDDEVTRLMKIWESVHLTDGQPFEKGIQVACSAVLVSPHFLFRIELDPKPNDPWHVYQLNDHEVATRLSYFLWSSMPDEELTNLANRGELLKDNNLVKQVHRMMRDRRSQAFVDNFGGQWLQTRNIDGLNFDKAVYPNFDESLRTAMQRESFLFFATLLVEDRSILEFIDSDFTFLNERLAKHYGIDGISGDNFRRVDLSGNFAAVERRGGLLGMAGILALNSNPARTSPVKRGKWIMENLLGTPPPPAPAMVPELDDDNAEKKGALKGTLKQRMEQHRSNPVCASCHKTMDNLGFGLENYDALGVWRVADGKEKVDSTGLLPNGSKFSGPKELKQLLQTKKEMFTRCLTEKMLTYALGRGLEEYDECTVDRISKYVASQNYKFSALLTGIVTSEPFLQKRGAGAR